MYSSYLVRLFDRIPLTDCIQLEISADRILASFRNVLKKTIANRSCQKNDEDDFRANSPKL
jgi:hypothetical protein